MEHSTRTRMMSITAQNTWVALPLKSPEYQNPISNGVQNNVVATLLARIVRAIDTGYVYGPRC